MKNILLSVKDSIGFTYSSTDIKGRSKSRKWTKLIKYFKSLTRVFACLQILIILSAHEIVFSNILLFGQNLMTENLSLDRSKITAAETGIYFNTHVQASFFILEHKISRNRSVVEHKSNVTIQNNQQEMALFKGQLIFTDFTKFYNVSAKHLQDPLIHRHQYKLSINNFRICNRKQIFLIFIIHSATFHFQERQLFRTTWASVNRFKDKNIEHVFILGQTANNTLNTQLTIESEKYNDIIQGNFNDSYRNLTYKHVLALYWTKEYCSNAKFVVKLDDDVMVNIPLLIGFLEYKTTSNNTSNVLDCKFYLNAKPFRSRDSKWYTTFREYPYIQFPPYCEGVAYIITLDVVRKFVEASKMIPFLWIDDVYAGGFLPWVTGVTTETPSIFIDVIGSSEKRNATSVLFYSYERRWMIATPWTEHWNYIINHD